MHALHLLLSVHLKPLLDIDTEVLALLLEAHLGPRILVKTFRARWMATLTVMHSDLISLALDAVPHFGSMDTVLNRVTSMANGAKLLIINLVIVLATEHLTAL